MSKITYLGTAKNFLNNYINLTLKSAINLSSLIRRVASSYFIKAYILYIGDNYYLKLKKNKVYAFYTYLLYLF